MELRGGQRRALVWSVGGHLGLASSFDSDDVAFDIGAQARLMYLLPWLSIEGSIDAVSSMQLSAAPLLLIDVTSALRLVSAVASTSSVARNAIST